MRSTAENHSVLYDVPAGALDDAGGDGPALGEGGGVVQVVVLVAEVAGAFVSAGPFSGRVPVGGGAAADPGRDLGCFPAQDRAGLGGDPFFGGGLALVEEGPGGLPQVFEHVDEVDLSRCRDKSTYAEYGTMPTVVAGRAGMPCRGALREGAAGRVVGIVTGFRGRPGPGPVACNARVWPWQGW